MRWVRLLFWFGKLPLPKPKLASRGPRMRAMMHWFASRSLLWAHGPRGGALGSAQTRRAPPGPAGLCPDLLKDLRSLRIPLLLPRLEPAFLLKCNVWLTLSLLNESAPHSLRGGGRPFIVPGTGSA